MHVFGLTGGIASGKSTVTRILRELGAEVLDADVIAREVVEPGTPGLAALNDITHPLVRQAFMDKLQALEERGVARVIYDVPLLIESGMHTWMEAVAVVWVPRAMQKARLMSRDGLDSDAADARLAAQLPLDDKRAHATWVIDNSGDLASTRAQVEAMWRAMLARG